MDGSGSATERVVGSRQVDTAGAGAGSGQGALAGRRVSPIPEGAPGRTSQQSPRAGGIASAEVKFKPIDSRQTTASPTPKCGPDSPSGQAREGLAPEQPPQSAGWQVRERRLPWLTPDEEAARRRFDAKVDELLDRDDVPGHQSDSLYAVADILSQVEDETLSVDELLERARRGWLNPQDWRKLSSLLHLNRHDLRLYQARQATELSGLVEAALLSVTDATLARESLQRLADSHNYLTSSGLPWADLVRRIETILPIGPGKPVAVDSRFVPGRLLRARLADGLPSGDSAAASPEARYRHVADLEQTNLANDLGEPLFSALRHRVIGAPELDGGMLTRLADHELKALVGTLPIGEARMPRADSTEEQQAAYRCRRIRDEPEFAEHCAEAMRTEACRGRARELAATALVSDRQQLQWALGGEIARVQMFSISLLQADDFETWSAQRDALAELESGSPLKLRVRGVTGEPCTILANVEVRQFALSAVREKLDANPLYAAPRERAGRLQAMTDLLGDENSRDLGGAVVASVEAIESQVQEMGHGVQGLEDDHLQSVQEHGDDHPASLDIGHALVRQKEDRDFMARRARTLREAGQQLKALWLAEGDWPAGGEAHRLAAARLALAAHLMGETPLLSYSGDRQSVAQLDAEVKFIATVADHQDGRLLDVDADKVAWKPARSDFPPQ